MIADHSEHCSFGCQGKANERDTCLESLWGSNMISAQILYFLQVVSRKHPHGWLLVGAFGSQSPFEGHKASYSVSSVFPSKRLLESIAVVETTLKRFWKNITPIKTT